MVVPFNRNLNSEPMIWALSIYIIANIYEALEDGEIGDEVGHYVNGEAIIF